MRTDERLDDEQHKLCSTRFRASVSDYIHKVELQVLLCLIHSCNPAQHTNTLYTSTIIISVTAPNMHLNNNSCSVVIYPMESRGS